MTKQPAFKKWVKNLSTHERLKHARAALEGASNGAHFLVNLHESNEILLKTDMISKQIPRSYAGNAYNAVTRCLRDIELVRLCSLWDRADHYSSTIPSVLELFDSPDVIEHMAREIAEHRKEILKVPQPHGSDDLDRAAIQQSLERMAQREWKEEYAWVHRGSRNTIRLARAVECSGTLENVRNFRNNILLMHWRPLASNRKKESHFPCR